MAEIKKINNFHSAISDTRNTFFLFKKLMETYNVDYLEHIKTNFHKIENQINSEYDLLDEEINE